VKSSETIEEEAEEAGKAGEAEKEKEKEAEDDKEEAANEEKQEEAPAKAKSTGKTLKQGDKLPKMMLKDEEGKEVDVSGLAGEKGVVIFLYPKVGWLRVVGLQFLDCSVARLMSTYAPIFTSIYLSVFKPSLYHSRAPTAKARRPFTSRITQYFAQTIILSLTTPSIQLI
jgi:hypothetical protein